MALQVFYLIDLGMVAFRAKANPRVPTPLNVASRYGVFSSAPDCAALGAALFLGPLHHPHPPQANDRDKGLS